MGSIQMEEIDLSYNDVVHNKVRSLEVIEEQLSKAINLTPASFVQIHSILGSAIKNVKTLKVVCSNEGTDIFFHQSNVFYKHFFKSALICLVKIGLKYSLQFLT